MGQSLYRAVEREHHASAPSLSSILQAQSEVDNSTTSTFRQYHERFAETLDRSNLISERKFPDAGSFPDLSKASAALRSYRDIAAKIAGELSCLHGSASHEYRLSQQTQRSESSKGKKDHAGITTLEDLLQWQCEAQTWDLLLSFVNAGSLPFVRSVSPSEKSIKDLVTFTEFSTEAEVYKKFLSLDPAARDCDVIVEWVKRSEQLGNSEKDHRAWLHNVCETRSGNWMLTREDIKARKRLRVDELDASSSSQKFTGRQNLVSELDPDATTRQALALDAKDQNTEEAIWKACWNLLRAGQTLEEVSTWLENCREDWRAAIIVGKAPIDDSSMPKWRSRLLWKQSLLDAARADNIDPHEKAVYGLLTGEASSIQRVSQKLNDHLLAHFNSLLSQRYDTFVTTRVIQDHSSKGLISDVEHEFETRDVMPTLSNEHILTRLRNDAKTQDEARQPFPMLQASLIAKSLPVFLSSYGQRLEPSSKTFASAEKFARPAFDSIIKAWPQKSFENSDFLRILTHLIFTLQDLGYETQKEEVRSFENIVLAYLTCLRKQGKHLLLPLYASRLRSSRITLALGEQLSFVGSAPERSVIISLMDQYGIDSASVLLDHIKLNIVHDSGSYISSEKLYASLLILDEPQALTSSTQPVRQFLEGLPSTECHQRLVNAFQWFLEIDGRWAETMAVGAVIYKHLLRTNDLLAAIRLASESPFSAIWLKKSGKILGHYVEFEKLQSLFALDAPDAARMENNSSSISIPKSADARDMWNASRTLQDLEKLPKALAALESWEICIAEVHGGLTQQAHATKMMNRSTLTYFGGRVVREGLKAALDQVETCVMPFLHGWLEGAGKDGKNSCFLTTVSCEIF